MTTLRLIFQLFPNFRRSITIWRQLAYYPIDDASMREILQARWLDALWCLLISIYILVGAPLVPFHGDESTQIYMGRDFYYLMDGTSVALSQWDTLEGDQATEQQLRLINGTLPKYLFGMVAYVSGYQIDEINDQWAWGLGWDWNHDNGHVPSDGLLLRARLVSSVLLALSAVALFCIGDVVAGRGVAYLASAYYALNPAILINGRRAMMEGGMLAFSLMVVVAGLFALKYRHWGYYVALGIVSGLAVASKHTSVVTVAATFAGCAAIIVLREKDQRQHLVYLLGSGLLSLVVFFVLNPAWWGNPAGAVGEVLSLRQDLLSNQVNFFDGYESPLAQAQGFISQTFVVMPMYAEVNTDNFIANQVVEINRYQQSLWRGISIGGSLIGAAVMMLLCIVGAVHLWRAAHIDASARWLISFWAVAMIALTLLLTPLEWQRYYLPIYPVVGLLAALGLEFSLMIVMQWWQTTRTNSIAGS